MRHLLIVEDDNGLRATMRDYLSLKGYRVSEAATGNDFVESVGHERHDLILLDLNLPDNDGLHLLEKLREHSKTPIFIVSGRTDDFSRLTALDLRADDYIIKPFNIRELELRIRNFIDRREEEKLKQKSQWHFGRYCFNSSGNILTNLEGERITLSQSESELLQMLLVADGGVVATSRIISQFNRKNISMTPESLPVIISRLRSKLQQEQSGQIIANMQGQGYYISVPIRTT